MTSLKTSIKTITYLSDIGCLEIQGASLLINEVVRVTLEVKVTFLAANELSQMLEVCVRLESLMP
ncbi:hypothetical protein AMA06_19760 [Salmonella enterica subsp. enterica serovar Mbandaka]|nr:hypothetical protein [Salmonella enterica subsp. enterica serovar Mbandaka]